MENKEIILKPDFTSAYVDELREYIILDLIRNNIFNITFNFAKVEQIDVSAIGLISVTRKYLESKNGTLELENVPVFMETILEDLNIL